MTTTVKCDRHRCRYNQDGNCLAPSIALKEHPNCFGRDVSDTGLLFDCYTMILDPNKPEET